MERSEIFKYHPVEMGTGVGSVIYGVASRDSLILSFGIGVLLTASYIDLKTLLASRVRDKDSQS